MLRDVRISNRFAFDMDKDALELPLFPLNVVLFPGQTLPLHVFEPRYRVMINRCIERGEPFGVVLARDDDPDSPYEIGTAARITQAERLDDGRLNILTVGVERFLLSQVRVSDDDYLIGSATPLPFKDEDAVPKSLRRRVVMLLRRYLKLLARTSGCRLKFPRIPRDASSVAVFAAIVLQIDLEDKQELLSLDSVADILEEELAILEDEVFALTLMTRAAPAPGFIGGTLFSLN